MLSSADILSAVQAQLLTSLAGTGARIILGVPGHVTTDREVYVAHDGASDVRKANSLVRRTHTIMIHVLVRVAAEDQSATELAFAPICDGVMDAFYGNATFSGLVSNSTIKQEDGPGGNEPLYAADDNALFRRRRYTLEVYENRNLAFA